MIDDEELDEVTEQYIEQSQECNEPPKISDLKHEEDISLLIKNISGILLILQEQMQTLPKTIEVLSKATENLTEISKDLPEIVYEQSLNEYKKIVNNAVKNYKVFQKDTIRWQSSLKADNENDLKWIKRSAFITPILLLLLLLHALF